MKRNALSDGIVTALFTMLALPVFAQEADTRDTDKQAKALDAVTVTGSRVVVPGLSTSSPVMTMDRETIDRTQPVSAEEFVRTSPGISVPVGPGTNNGSNGGAMMSMRSLGSNRNLVLIDGRRMVPYTLNGQVDVNTIPLALLSGVDFLTGGASAVYGADAVSGVANFMLKRDFEGVEISASMGQSLPGSDQVRRRLDVTGGFGFAENRGNLTLSVGRTFSGALFQGQREVGLVSINSGTGRPQGSNTAVPAQVSIVGSGRLTNQQVDIATGGLVPRYGTYNFNPLNYFYTPMNRDQGTLLGRFEITPRAELYTQAFQTKSRVQLSLAPSGSFGNTFEVPIGNPYIPDAMRQQICADRGIVAADCVAGNATPVEMAVNRRFTEYGPRFNDIETRTRQYVFGVRGDLSDHWSYDAYHASGKSVQSSARVNWGARSRLAQALNATSTTACVGGGDCVPIDVFGPEGSITPDMLRFLDVTSVGTTTVRQKVFSAFVNGDLGERLKSPWSETPIGVAFGVERRSMEAGSSADLATQTRGEVLGTGAPTPDRSGGFTISEAYLESIVPLVEDKTAFRRLNLELGYRRSRFETSAGTGFNYGTWKYGLAWKPVEDLTFRAMFQRAVRAPNVNELFAPVVTGLANLARDPCAGTRVSQAEANTPGTLSNLCRLSGVPVSQLGVLSQPNAGQVNVRAGGNPQLTPEVANTRTFGLVFEPSFIGNLSMTLDYWQINLTEAISAPAVGDPLRACYGTAANPGLAYVADCQNLGRDPKTGLFNGGGSDGILLARSNLGRIDTRGYDLGLYYQLGLGDAGRLNFASQSTWTREFRRQPTPASVNRDCRGFYSTDCDFGPFRFKSNLTTVWTRGGLDASWRIRHQSSMRVESGKVDFLAGFARIPAYTYHDLSIGYRFPHTYRLTLSVNNVLNRQPPMVGNTIGTTSTNSGNTFPQWYDVIGRYWNLGVTIKF
ncbi:TonB-dependent receptor domain-containing protein [Solilutibacter pythonis]|nr:TonB-dependent receptor [Lysobacter pythonis]